MRIVRGEGREAVSEDKNKTEDRADFIRGFCEGHTNFEVHCCGEFERDIKNACERAGFRRPSSAQVASAVKEAR